MPRDAESAPSACHPSWCFTCGNTGRVPANIAKGGTLYTTSCRCACHEEGRDD